MIPVYYIGKRTLLDILHSGVFWGALVIAGLACFVILYVGFRHAMEEPNPGPRHHRGQQQQFDGSGDPDESPDLRTMPIGNPDPKDTVLWFVYAATIGFSNLLAIFIMIGLLSRDIENHRIDIILARPVSRGQIYFGKLFGGWISLAIFMALMAAWTLVCMLLSGMGAQPKYFNALYVGLLSPFLISALTLLMSIWMKGILAGLLGTVMTFAAGNFGTFIISWLGIEILKLDKVVFVLHRILPPLNVIGSEATTYLHTDLNMRLMMEVFESALPKDPGLYTAMWQVWVYFAVIVILGWLSLFRRQFT